MTDIITLGELLIDLTQRGSDENGNGEFTAYPGGAPANVAVAASRLGASAGFIGKVGNDAFGRSLADTLKKDNVDIKGLYYDDDQPTTMAIVSVDATGERDFSFYRKPGADTQLTVDEAVEALADLPKILHVGSLSMTTSPGKEACVEAVKYAKDNGSVISYDPNYRAALWDSEEHAIEMMKVLLPYADILKVSDEEMVMLTGTDDFEAGSRTLAEYGCGLVMVTLGSDGVFVRMGSHTATVPGFSVEVADTNGAGDTFLGAMLMQIAKGVNGEEDVWKQLLDMVRYANKAASLTCSRHGAIPAMPTLAEMEREFNE
ncbi:MAG: carbohydrate kinase [Mogibacterium sp.]|nr:carbohydrate kinase [Mogibacterium sp.]MBQ6501321.1 carbohydrate kinase [Mogibacterium sp.]